MRMRKGSIDIPDAIAIEAQTRPIGTYDAIAACGAFFDSPLRHGARQH